MDRQKLLEEFTRRLVDALGENLVSVVLFGSAAADDYQEGASDLNVLCAVDHLDVDRLEKVFLAADWWTHRDQPPPVVLSLEEIENAADAFAIEFLDIRMAYRVLHGRDVVAGIEIDRDHHRRQVEYELRARLVRLRDEYVRCHRERKAVLALMLDALPTFAALFRHGLMVAGEEAPLHKSEVFQAAAARFGTSREPFEKLLACRAGKGKLATADIRPLFEQYLREITKTAEAVDRLVFHPHAERSRP